MLPFPEESRTKGIVAPESGQPSPTLEETVEEDKVQTDAASAAVVPESSIRIRLTVTQGPHQGRQFSFSGHDTFLAGRSKRAHFRLPHKDKTFSRIHFLVELNPPQCRLLDMGSHNGTAVNGRKVSTADLNDGDIIKAGRTTLQVAIDQVVDEASATIAAAVPTGGPERAEPPIAAEPVPSRPHDSSSPVAPAAACRLCLSPLEPTETTASAKLRLCSSCREQIKQHAQPIAGYQISRELGRGGMGVVYLALREATGSAVALKTVTPAAAATPPKVQRFLREATILEQLDHPHIVSFREMGTCQGRLFFAMDYVRGTDARRLLKEHGPFAIDRAVALVKQLLEALEYAHACQFVHRDIKPANVLIAAESGRDIVKLADFGLARVYQGSPLSGLTVTGDFGGTVAFMPLEQLTDFKGVKPAADQYSAAATLYTLLTGRHIYDLPANHQKRLLMILHDEPVPIQARRPEIPADLAAIIHRALAKDPGDRFANVQAFREALKPFALDEPANP